MASVELRIRSLPLTVLYLLFHFYVARFASFIGLELPVPTAGAVGY
jgi:hypothetical protein